MHCELLDLLSMLFVYHFVNTSECDHITQVGAESVGYYVSIYDYSKTVDFGDTSNDRNGQIPGHVQVYVPIGDSWVKVGGDIDGEDSNFLWGVSVSIFSGGKNVAFDFFKW